MHRLRGPTLWTDERRLHTRFVRAAQSHAWQGRDLPADTKRRIALVLDADARVAIFPAAVRAARLAGLTAATTSPSHIVEQRLGS
jgi:hypothetical protein